MQSWTCTSHTHTRHFMLILQLPFDIYVLTSLPNLIGYFTKQQKKNYAAFLNLHLHQYLKEWKSLTCIKNKKCDGQGPPLAPGPWVLAHFAHAILPLWLSLIMLRVLVDLLSHPAPGNHGVLSHIHLTTNWSRCYTRIRTQQQQTHSKFLWIVFVITIIILPFLLVFPSTRFGLETSFKCQSIGLLWDIYAITFGFDNFYTL